MVMEGRVCNSSGSKEKKHSIIYHTKFTNHHQGFTRRDRDRSMCLIQKHPVTQHKSADNTNNRKKNSLWT